MTAREWAKEIENKFVLFWVLFNDKFILEAHATSRNNVITLEIIAPEGVDLSEKSIQKAIKSAINMAARGCPYEYSYLIKE